MSKRKNEAKWIESRKRWQINVQADGERRTFISIIPYQSGKKSQPGKIEAEKKADKWLDERLVNENVRVEKMLDRWYESLKMSTSPAHYNQQDSYIKNWIKPYIGTRRMSGLTEVDLQEIINRAYKKGHLAKKSLKNIRACLMAFMKYCRKSKVTNLHVEDPLTIPKGAKESEKTVATAKELLKLFGESTTKYKRKVIEDRHINMYRFSVLTGMRPGELIGLLNTNIKSDKVTITQSINDDNETTKGKNENARRTYTLDYHAMKVLQDQKDLLKRLGQISPYVFPSADGSFVDQEKYRRAWKRFCKFHGIENANTPYEMRHTFVSVNKEMPDGLKKMVVGHSKDMDSDGTYGHEMEGDMEQAAFYVGEAFKKVLGW